MNKKPKQGDWEKELHIAMEEVRPADWYYKFIRQLLLKERDKVGQEMYKIAYEKGARTQAEMDADTIQEEREKTLRSVLPEERGTEEQIEAQKCPFYHWNDCRQEIINKALRNWGIKL